jgi:DNA-binding LacI/PurR family transcriptional regulator
MITTVSKRVTMQQIASKAGVTRVTVSLALRSHPGIPETTRRRILGIVNELGYRPNPMISALMADVRARNPGQRTCTIAYLTHATKEMMREIPAAGRYFSGARRHAEELGYHLEYFHFQPDTNARSVGRTLRMRGIRGVLLPPVPNLDFSFDLEWQYFCVATLGYSLRAPKLNRSVNHQYNTMRTVFDKALEKGFRRIGLMIRKQDDDGTNNIWGAAYLASQQLRLDERQRLTFFYFDQLTPAQLARWFKKERPDVIISLARAPTGELRAAGIEPLRDVNIVLLDRAEDQPHLSGMDQRPDLVGAMGVDLVAQDMINNACGLPRFPKTILTEGVWIDAASPSPPLPPAAANSPCTEPSKPPCDKPPERAFPSSKVPLKNPSAKSGAPLRCLTASRSPQCSP